MKKARLRVKPLRVKMPVKWKARKGISAMRKLGKGSHRATTIKQISLPFFIIALGFIIGIYNISKAQEFTDNQEALQEDTQLLVTRDESLKYKTNKLFDDVRKQPKNEMTQAQNDFSIIYGRLESMNNKLNIIIKTCEK